MTVKMKVLSAARWAADDAQEQVTGGFRRNSNGGSPAFSYKWLREIISAKVSDKALTAALEELVSAGYLLELNGNFRLNDSADEVNQIVVLIGVAYANPGFHYPKPAMARALGEEDNPEYLDGKLLLDGQSYVQRRDQTELEADSPFGPNLIRTNLRANSRDEENWLVQEFASEILLAGTKIWFREGTIE